MQGLEAFAFAPSQSLVNERSNEVVNIASTEMLNKLFAVELDLQKLNPSLRVKRSNPVVFLRLWIAWLAMTVFSSQ